MPAASRLPADPVAPAASATAGAGAVSGALARAVVVAGPAVLVLLLAALALGMFEVERDARRWVAHTRQVLATTDSLRAAVQDAEWARREAVIGVGDSADYRAASARVRARSALAQLRALTQDNAAQQRRLDRLTPVAMAELAAFARGDSLSPTVHGALQAFAAGETRLLAEREARENEVAYLATVGILLGAVIAALLALFTSRLLAVLADDQRALAHRMTVQNEQLTEQTVELEMQQQAQQEQTVELEMQTEQLQEQAVEMETQQQLLIEQNLELTDLAARLSHEEARITRLIDTVPSGLVETDATGQIIWANAAAERILRIDRDTMLERGHADVSWENRTWTGELVAPADTAIGRALTTGQVVQGAELTIRDPATDQRVYLRINASPVRDDLGTIVGALAAFDDATSEAQATAQLRYVAESGVVGVFSWTLDGGVVEANDAFLQMVHATRDDLAAGRIDWRTLTPTEYADSDAQAVDDLLRTGRHRAYRKTYVALDGEPVPVVIASAFLPGSRAKGMCVCLDVRTLANAEAAERAARTQAERLQAVTAGFSGALTPQEVATVLSDAGRRAAGASAAVVGLLTRADTPGAPWELERAAETGTGLADVLPGARAQLEDAAPLTDVARSRVPHWSSGDADGDGERGGTAWCALPLVVARDADGDGPDGPAPHTLGAVAFGFASPQRFDGPQRRYLLTIANQAAQALERARLYREAQAGNEAKSGFMATMSHELRTPLNALIGYSDLLLLGIPDPIPPTAHDQVGRMRTAARHLLGLIEEILLHARLEAGRVEVQADPIDLDALVDEVATVVAPLAAARGLTFRTESRLPAHATAVTDAGKLRQILINLAGNAVKFTERGGVTLRAHADAHDDTVVFVVEDSGIGIAPEYLEKVFDPFWQVSQHQSAQRPAGTGLGLSVTRRLARLLGGDVAVESARGTGSRFTVRIARQVRTPTVRVPTSGTAAR